MMSSYSWMIVIFLCYNSVSVRSEKSLNVALTVRDFMPSWCMPNSSYTEAWNNLPPPYIDETLDILNHGISDSDLAEGVNSRGCPYFELISSGDISGHPYMEDAHFSGSESLPTAVFGSTLQKASSGLGKPVHCSVTNSCPDALNPGRESDFNTLFRDDAKFNKRSGFSLQLDFDEDYGTFRYNSQNANQEENNQFGIESKDLESPYKLATSYDDDENSVPERFFGPLDRFIISDSSYYVSEENFPDPLNSFMEAWPQKVWESQPEGASGSFSIRVKRTANHKFWFTTELHTTFEYYGGEVFNFNVQDLAWVYIDDQLVLSLDGTESDTAGLLELDNLGLERGHIYTLDAFEIEKHTGGSTWLFESSLTETCNVLQSGSISDYISLANSSFTNVDDSVVVNVEEINEKATLLRAGDNFSATNLFFKQQVNVGSGFVLKFYFKVDALNDGGFAVVFHRRDLGLQNIPTSGVSQMGFKGIENSIAIVFDLCFDRSPLNCSTQQIRLHYENYTIFSSNGVNERSLKVYDNVLSNLKTGEEHSVTVQYLESPDHLNVFLDGSLYLRQSNFNLEEIIHGRNAYVGFTAGQSILTSKLDIYGVSLETVGVDPLETVVLNTSLYGNLEFYADGEDYAEVILQTRDFCQNEIQFGGESERINVELLPAGSDVFENTSYSIVDEDTGSYSIRIYSTNLVTFNIFISHGIDCPNYSEFYAGDLNPNCTHIYLGDTMSSVEALPVTEAPTLTGLDSRDVALSGEVIYMLSGIGAILVLLIVLLALFLTRYRHNWNRDRHYVAEGSKAIMERNQLFSGRDILSDLNHENATLKRGILEEKAKLVENLAHKKRLESLRSEKEELHSTLRHGSFDIDTEGDEFDDMAYTSTLERKKRRQYNDF